MIKYAQLKLLLIKRLEVNFYQKNFFFVLEKVSLKLKSTYQATIC